MNLALQASPSFSADSDKQVAWYVEHASEQVARRYTEALARTLDKLRENPDVGSLCKFRHVKLRGLRFCLVARPFHKHIVFYRHDERTLYVERVMHGARNLPRRLVEPPETG